MNRIVSTIQLSALVNRPFLRNMIAFADEHNVNKIELFVMPGKNKDESTIATVLMENPRIELLFLDKTGKKINNNLKLFDLKILASQINPLTGVAQKLSRDYSHILPATKVRYMSLPNTSKYPRFIATTGALSSPNYKMHTAQGQKSELLHEYGFAFIEVKNNRIFNYHPVMALKNGNFNFNREFYRNGKKEDQQPEALILGDIHVGDTCMKSMKVSVQMIADLKPKRVVLHDLFNGHSINHHERSNNLSKAQLWKKKMHILEEEVNECQAFLNDLAYKFPDVQFLVVESNHDLFMKTYISYENFLADGQNSVFSCRLFVEMDKCKPQPILQTAMELQGKIAKNVQFLKEDDEHRVKGIELGYHGHRGINGARGTSMSFSNNNLMLISGHEHTPKIHPKGMVVGTLTKLKLDYTKGASSWLNANGLLYSSGKYTLLTIIN